MVVEKVGNDFLVLCGKNGVAHRLPSSFQKPIDALLAGEDVSGYKEEIRILDQFGLLDASKKLMPSRRQAVSGFTGLLGAGVATIALPTAAFASSATFFVSNTAFLWRSDGAGGFDIGDAGPLNATIFTVGSSWTITVETGSDTATATAVVVAVGGESGLVFNFPGATLASGLVLLGRLSGPGGATSNQFQISETPAG